MANQEKLDALLDWLQGPRLRRERLARESKPTVPGNYVVYFLQNKPKIPNGTLDRWRVSVFEHEGELQVAHGSSSISRLSEFGGFWETVE